jgi:hypothetical protein
MKFLLLNDRYTDLTSKIKGIGFFNPFFNWKNAIEMESAAAFFNMNLDLLKMQNAENEFNFHRAPEKKYELW